MTARELALALLATKDLDRKIPISAAIKIQDRETEERLRAFLSLISLTHDEPVVQDEAVALLVKITLP